MEYLIKNKEFNMRNNILKFSDENINKKWDYENGFYLTSDISRLGKQIAHYEIYKQIVGIPGEILEFGVYKGSSMIRFATYRELLENTYSRKIIGFDVFGEFPKTDRADDNEFIELFENSGGNGIDKSDLEAFIDYKGIRNIDFIEGNILKTLPNYVDSKKYLKISLLHIDVDVYEPTKFILEKLYDRVVTGGIIVFDDYSKVTGATDAIDEFMKDKKEKINKLSFSHIPSYIVKQ
jgi:hypothetical protein